MTAHRTARGQLQHDLVVIGQRLRRDDLQIAEAGPVVDVQEGESGLRIAPGADPALDGQRGVDGVLAGKNGLDARVGHIDPGCPGN